MEITRNKKPDRSTMSHKLANRLGTATLTPCVPVVAGSYQQWTLTLHVGSYGIDERGTIKEPSVSPAICSRHNLTNPPRLPTVL